MIYKDGRPVGPLDKLTQGEPVYSFDLEPNPMEALAKEITRTKGRRLGDDTVVGMQIKLYDGSAAMVIEKVSQWRKWFQDGTIKVKYAS